MTKEEIEKLRELERRASIAPWSNRISPPVIHAAEPGNKRSTWVCQPEFEEDRDFICALRNSAKELLDAAEENAKLREALGYYADPSHYDPFETLGGTRPPPVLAGRGSLARRALGIEGGWVSELANMSAL